MSKNNDLKKREELFQYVNSHFLCFYNRDTTTISNICRQLAFGEGGMCWFIISSDKYSPIIPPYLINTILIMLVIFFLVDAAQYLFSSSSIKNLARRYHEQIENNVINDKSQLTFPKEINTPANICFVLKLLILLATSLFLIYLILMRHPC